MYTQLSCNAAQHTHYNHTAIIPSNSSHNPSGPFYHTLDPLGYALAQQSNYSYDNIISFDNQDQEEGDPRRLPSNRCLSDPVVQASAARLSAIMTITMGGLSALTTGWWGKFGERHGRTRVLATATLGLFLACVQKPISVALTI